MSNANSCVDVIYSQNLGQPIVLNWATTGRFAFALGGQPAVLNIPNPMASIPGGAAFPGRSAQALGMILRAGGTATLGGGVLYQIDICQGTGLAPIIATTSKLAAPQSGGNQKFNWLIEIEAMWDSASTNLNGIVYGWAGQNAISQVALVQSSPASLANLQFTCVATVQNTNAINTMSLTMFDAEFV